MEGCIIIHKQPSHEYFCKDCLQLRLSLLGATKACGNCGSKDIIIGKVNKLNKEELKNQYESRTSKED